MVTTFAITIPYIITQVLIFVFELKCKPRLAAPVLSASSVGGAAIGPPGAATVLVDELEPGRPERP